MTKTTCCCRLLLLLASAPAAAGLTADAAWVTSRLDGAGLPDGHAAETRLTWQRAQGDVARLAFVDERRFGEGGGVLAAGYTRVLAPEWTLGATLALGRGGPIWARRRADLDLSAKASATSPFVARLGAYRAEYDGDRSDQGWRAAGTLYLDGGWVLEAGATWNRSQPGGVPSRMPYAAATWGREGGQWLSLTVRSGREAYQAIGAEGLLADFHSRSLRGVWRQWWGGDWGTELQAEHYRNPSYTRHSVGLGLFLEWE